MKLIITFREIKKYKNVFRFLIAYFFYIDGVNTMISMAAAYGRDVGLSVSTLLLAILMIQIIAFPFTILFGKLANRTSTKFMIYAGIGIYSIITFVAYLMPSFESLSLRTILFWILAFLVASSQGGIQALSRSFYAKIIPSEKSSEFFGFYNVFGKFATILGPALMAFVGSIFGHSKYGVLSIFILFSLGIIFLKKVEE